MPSTDEQDGKVATIVRALADAGHTDVLVLDQAASTDVLTDRRQELLRAIEETNDASVTELADRLDRDKSAVSRDLSLLFEYDIVEFETMGQRKIPSLKHETVLHEPLL
jgi:predicted transcriptional regulator